MKTPRAVLVALLMGGILSARLDAASFLVSVDTTPLAGRSGFLAFDFTAGFPVPGNSTVISGFSTDSALGSGVPSGDASGTLVPGPLTLGDTQFFNEWLQGITSFGTTLSYRLDLGSLAVLGGFPDSFSFFLLDSNKVPFATTDPSGADALFTIDLTGPSTAPVVFSSDFAVASVEPVPVGVPEPSSLWLLLVPLLLLRRKTTP